MTREDTLVIESLRCGRVEVKSSALLYFQGIPGFPHASRFVVFEHAAEAPFSWLISADLPELAFVIADPWEFFPDYAPQVDPSRIEELGAKDGDELEVLVIVSVSDAGEVTMNLAAPLIIHPHTHKGVQVILEQGDYSVRQPLPKLEAEVGDSDSSQGQPRSGADPNPR